ncbi:UDP-N-acetylmuramate:L-alanyl-gamma-D-glutamyl-me so-diaminopimelate ligase [Desulfoluna limicola]|uniref:UDP-N-acetylmuramate:L-alanyl-gamma-D-glutamyl-me so-diaminopimelate ligase n=1 Tax=Desulfoluna limicola TaxID=2810562 RepID=A0ABN6F0G7_9BACT|nr:UDP-N-acetylmuramate--L-alanine ligase [Desulfoluna limicola]BCS95056.1 UDP-N-acetylmuramate:L-alanyl-gamma-D-glutamyl-me so-diaminopimelate ligase [Desulfoluna limicola]
MQQTPPHYLDPLLNGIPEGVRRVHLIAVCGTGMGALALMLKEAGMEVTGSDAGIYPPMSDLLRDSGITLYEGFKPEHIGDVDLVVVGNAVRKENPEAMAVGERRLSYCSFPQAVAGFFGRGKRTVVVSGTHGKTTTSSMMAWVLEYAGLNPSFMIGGVLHNFSSNCKVGEGDFLVVEGDEYDTAFFDKGPKFLHYDPEVTILTSVEFDHADIFRDLAHVMSAFSAFLARHRPEAAVVAGPGANVAHVTANAPCDVLPYGFAGKPLWRPEVLNDTAPETTFRLFHGDALFGDYSLPMPGGHNVENAVSVIAACDRLGLDSKLVAEALASFKGVKRRQEIRGEVDGVVVMDDFAHHPTAVASTLAAVRSFYRDHRLVAIFEPRTNSSMRDVFQDAYAHAFEAADLICVRTPPHPEKVPEGERFSSEALVAALNVSGKEALLFSDADAIVSFFEDNARSGDLLMVMSNGGFEGIHGKLLSMLEAKRETVEYPST